MRTPSMAVPIQPTQSKPIHTAATPAAIMPVQIAGDATNAIEYAIVARALARPLTRSLARLLTSGEVVGAIKVSPTANRPLNTSTAPIRSPAETGSADRPKTAQDAAQIRPMTDSARLRRSRLTRRSTNSWKATMTAVLSEIDSATI